MAHTYTETIGIINGVIAHMSDANNQSALTAKNFDMTPHLTRLQTKLANITALNAQQEKMKVDLAKKTTELNGASDDGYADASGLLDAMAGMYGKSSNEGKNVLKIRSGIRKGGSETTPPTPPKS